MTDTRDDEAFPASDDAPMYLFKPRGITTGEAFEITQMFLAKMLGLRVDKGAFSGLALTQDYVEMLSDQAQRHFRPMEHV